jgi:chitin disaccharide deacetylase
MHVRSRLIINADDFGKDDTTNQTILANLSSGEITSASIMANGDSFQKACEMVDANNIDNAIGIHLTLDEGIPLSEKMKSFTNDRGEMCLKRKPFIFDRDLLSAAYFEVRAQIVHVMNHGIMPTHLDSHRHFHVSFSIGRIVIALAREFGIRHVRLARNLACASNFRTGMYKWLFNTYLSSRIETTDRFTDLFDFYEKFRNERIPKGTIECMCHLDASERGLRDQELLQSSDFGRLISNYELVSFSSLE